MVGRWQGFCRSVVGFWSVLPTHSKKFSFLECSRRKSGVLECYFYICFKLLTLPNNDFYIFRFYFLILMSFFWLNKLQKFRPTDRPNHRPDPTDPTFKIEVFGTSDPTRLPIQVVGADPSTKAFICVMADGRQVYSDHPFYRNALEENAALTEHCELSLEESRTKEGLIHN